MARTTTAAPSPDARKDHIAEARARLEAATAALTDSAAYRRHLRMLARFHRYSFNNTLLIAAQRPDATYVAGYQRWLDLGRQVRKGETALRILAPRPYLRVVTNDDGTEEERSRVSFATACVFDLAQTDPIPGHPRPFAPPATPDVTGDPALASRIFAALVAHLNAAGVTVQTRDDAGRAHAAGWYWQQRHQVYVRPAGAATMLAVLIHEAAHHHAHGHQDGEHGYAANEVIAQSVAFVVCDRVGIDAGDFSAAYAAAWLRRDPDGFKKGMGFVQQAASTLIAALERATEAIAEERIAA